MATKKQDLGGAVEGPPLTPPPPQTGPAIYPAIYRQMNAAMGAFAKAGLAKMGKNQQQNFSFRGIDDLMDLASPILVEHGILVFPNVVSRVVSERETRNGAILYSVTLDVEYSFVSALDGSRETVRFVGEAMDSGDKASNKALSAAYKYAFFQTFCIPIRGAQDEADLTTHEETVKVPPPPAAPEGYAQVKDTAFAQANAAGTEGLRAYARVLGDGGKDSPGFKAWGHLVKVDGDYAKLRGIAEAFDADKARKAAVEADKAEVARVVEALKATGVRVPGEEG